MQWEQHTYSEDDQDTYSSDSIPFADNGIPGINVTRFGVPGTAYIHNRYDVIKYLDYKNLQKTGSYQRCSKNVLILQKTIIVLHKLPIINDYIS